MTFSDKDKEFMRIAIEQAKEALEAGDAPIGAILAIDGKLVGKSRNHMYSNDDWGSHAEIGLLKDLSPVLNRRRKSNSVLYCTLEPCIMCFGAALINRVSRIVFSCPDPHGGATHLKPEQLGALYVKIWPKIEGGLFKEETSKMLLDFIKNKPEWKNVRKSFETLDLNRKK